MDSKIAFVTDLHLDEQFPKEHGVDSRKNWKTILRDIENRNINTVVFGGDIGDKASNKWFFKSLHPIKHLICLGNHDSHSEVIKYFGSKNNEPYYCEENILYKFIIMDSSTERINENQLYWLRKELQTSKKIILFIHHPIIPIDVEVDRQYSLKGRDKIVLELEKAGKRVTVFCGHYHMADECRRGNITQIVTPASSYQIEKTQRIIKVNNHSFGYRIIELKEDEVKTELVLF